MSTTLAVDGVRVSLDPSSVAADAIRCLLQTLGITAFCDDPSAVEEVNSRPGADIVIAGRPPPLKLSPPPNVWVTVTERSFDANASADVGDVTLGFGPVAEMLTAAHAVLVALAGFYASRRTGRSIVASIAMSEVTATCVTSLLLPSLCERPAPPRQTAEARTVVLQCSDGAVSVTLNNQDRIDLAEMTGVASLADVSPELFKSTLQSWSRELTRDEVVQSGQTWRIPILPAMPRDEASREKMASLNSPFRVRDTPTVSIDEPATLRSEKPSACGATRPLTGVRVLDLGMVWAGPYCGRLLAGLGAEVVKVEGPRRRDGTRPPDDWSGCSGFFADLNRNKKSLVLDLSAEAGRSTFGELIHVIDIVLENFSPRVMPNFGLDYSVLSKLNSKIVQISMPAFESDGERAQFVSYGSGLELLSGLGIPGQDGELEPAPVPYLDLLTGVYGAIAAVTALLRRDQVGVGSWVEVAQCLLARDLTQWCPDDLWSVRKPSVDPGAIIWSSSLLASDFFSRVRGDGYCHHLSRCPWIIEGSKSREPSAPKYGADSARVLKGLGGVTKDAFDRFIRLGVVVDSARIVTGVA